MNEPKQPSMRALMDLVIESENPPSTAEAAFVAKEAKLPRDVVAAYLAVDEDDRREREDVILRHLLQQDGRPLEYFRDFDWDAAPYPYDDPASQEQLGYQQNLDHYMYAVGAAQGEYGMRAENSEHAEYEALLGAEIGRGRYRTVYRHRHDPDLVVKRGNRRCNRREHRIWERASESERRALAPVVAISRSGEYLVMRRTEPLDRTRLTDDVLRYMVSIAMSLGDLDMNPANYGELDGSLVCHDYGGMPD